MKAYTYVKPGLASFVDVDKPVIRKPTDAIVRIVKTTICGTDLHIIKGDVPACQSGTILGHEGIGIVEEVGEGVSNFKKGDKVLILVSVPAVNATTVKKEFMPTVKTKGAGFSVT